MLSDQSLQMLTRSNPVKQGPAGRASAMLITLLMTFAAAAEQPEADTDQQLAAKLDPYVECINFHGNWTLQSRDRYFSWLKSQKAGPTGREDIVYGLYELRDGADCRKEIDAAAALPPDDPELEAAAEAFISALEAATIVVDEAHTYYELGNWQDDKMRQGKALHPRLLTVFENFAAADDALRERVDRLQSAATERRLARLEADPKQRAEYLVERLAFSAEKMLDHSSGIGAKDFQRERFAEVVGEFETAWQAFDEFAKANPKHPNRAIRDSMVAHNAFDLLKCAKTTVRRERQGFRFTEGERMLIEAQAGQMVEGHPAQLVDKYNRFVGSMNSARR